MSASRRPPHGRVVTRPEGSPAPSLPQPFGVPDSGQGRCRQGRAARSGPWGGGSSSASVLSRCDALHDHRRVRGVPSEVGRGADLRRARAGRPTAVTVPVHRARGAFRSWPPHRRRGANSWRASRSRGVGTGPGHPCPATHPGSLTRRRHRRRPAAPPCPVTGRHHRRRPATTHSASVMSGSIPRGRDGVGPPPDGGSASAAPELPRGPASLPADEGDHEDRTGHSSSQQDVSSS